MFPTRQGFLLCWTVFLTFTCRALTDPFYCDTSIVPGIEPLPSYQYHCDGINQVGLGFCQFDNRESGKPNKCRNSNGRNGKIAELAYIFNLIQSILLVNLKNLRCKFGKFVIHNFSQEFSSLQVHQFFEISHELL